MSKSLRVLYAAGPGNVIGSYSYWRKGEDDPSQVAITYSSQFYDACRDLDAEGYIISSCKDKKLLREGKLTLEHRPNPLQNASGLLYHLGQVWYGLGLIATAIAWRADFAIVADGTTHWFVLSILSFLGVQAVPSLHCTLWRKFGPQRKIDKLLSKLNRIFFAKSCTAIMVISHDVAKQLASLTEDQTKPIVQFKPTYRRAEFASVKQPDTEHSPFRVLFVGRVEENKGVFDILEIAKRFAALGRKNITFDICGNGSALEALRQEVKLAGVESAFTFHGYCNKVKMREMFSQAHAVIVPTKTDFVEGFNKVIAEGVLSGRPVITSAVCPAVSHQQGMLVEVPPDDVTAYGDAILKLCDDREFYEQKRQYPQQSIDRFYDVSNGWGGALKSILVSQKTNVYSENNLDGISPTAGVHLV
ncbi:MAG: glycosyltransferase family 4 protein [Oscillatoriaceae cyanobacterium Prado104]|nr:glycosyltransferase family 4 protein [Oscillatoriaceae cyanobacterium Prado104]